MLNARSPAKTSSRPGVFCRRVGRRRPRIESFHLTLDARMDPILVGKAVTTEDSGKVWLLPPYANRHGLVAGATGTGKTVTLMTIAEGFSRIGVPVFMADVKGDIAGLAVAGSGDAKVLERAAQIGVPDYAPAANPVIFWDLYGKRGHPVRTTVSEMGPTLLAR